MQIKLEHMWMELEKEFVNQNISAINDLKFPKKLSLRDTFNYYAIMLILYIVFLTLLISYFIIAET